MITKVNTQLGIPSQADPTTDPRGDTVFDRLESEVRSYCRAFPTVFHRAKGSVIVAADGTRYLDFFAGAGALNYGHNHPRIKAAVLRYLADDGIAHGLDLHTTAKAEFLESFAGRILDPRSLAYKVQFTGPTGTNAVEAALKLARKATGRSGVLSFMGGYHGHSLGSLAATANRDHRAGAGVPLGGVSFLPYPSGPLAATAGIDTLAYLEAVLADTHSGIDLPAAIIVETIQAEGGICVAPADWLRGLRRICTANGIVLIVDDIQVGCGRTGPFFSFERAGLTGNDAPDLVTLSKSIGGLGLPMALLLMKPELDVWNPAEHTGTFRGNQLAFVAATAALEVFDEEGIEAKTAVNGSMVWERLFDGCVSLDERIAVRGAGMIWGLDLGSVDPTGGLAKAVGRQCFDDGLIIERVGRNDTVLKVLPPLTITADELDAGLGIIEGALKRCLGLLVG